MSGLTEKEISHNTAEEFSSPVDTAPTPAGESPSVDKTPPSIDDLLPPSDDLKATVDHRLPPAADAPPKDTEDTAKPEAWPYLPHEVIEEKWQQAVNTGPRLMGRQVSYALAASLKRDPNDTAPTQPHLSAYSTATADETGLVALASLSQDLSVQQRIALLTEVQALENLAIKARALLLLVPQLSGEKRRLTIREIYEASKAVKNPSECARLLTTLLPLLHSSEESELPSGIVAETMDIASTIKDTEARLRSLTALAPYLPPTVRIALLLAVLDTIATLPQSDAQAGALVSLAPHLTGEVHHRTLTVAAHIKDPAPRARVLTVLAQHLPARLQPRLRAAALEAIASIPNEEERAIALADFAPHLEDVNENDESFPVLLERALALGVNMNRRDARARALVGLQARLPHNLQGEALAAVNAIPDEHDRAQMLADLAPSLPPDLSVAALAIAHDIRQRDARFLALKALGSRMNEKAAERTWLDALAVAVALPRQLERVMALGELAPNLPAELKHRTLVNALTTARSITKERARVRAIATLAPLLGDYQQLLADALADAYTISNPVEKVSALIALVPFLPEEPRNKTIEVALGGMREITVEYRRSRALASLAPQLEGEALKTATDIALDIADPYDRSTTLMALLSRVLEDGREEMLKHIWDAARDIMDHYDRATALSNLWPHATADMQAEIVRAVLDAVKEISDDYDRASGISVFAPLLAAESMPSALPSDSQVLREALLAACRIDTSAARAEALADLIPYWTDVHPTPIAYTLWCEILPQLSQRPVPQLLSDIAALTPVLRAIGGKAAAEEATRVVAAARKW